MTECEASGVNHKRVQRLIQEMGLQVCTKKQRKYSPYKGEQGKIALNLLQRDFSASKPNEKWLTDITKFRVKDEKLYFSPILDCFNNELIAYGLSRRPNGMLVQEMLLQAVEKCEVEVRILVKRNAFHDFYSERHSNLCGKLVNFRSLCNCYIIPLSYKSVMKNHRTFLSFGINKASQ